MRKRWAGFALAGLFLCRLVAAQTTDKTPATAGGDAAAAAGKDAAAEIQLAAPADNKPGAQPVLPPPQAVAPPVPSEDRPPIPGPRIGVALDGGGALGLAHIGVLLWMEEHHIPVQVVAGTSMGGLIGGLYATGRSPQEIDAFAEAINWDAVLGETTAFPDLAYRRKEDEQQYPASLQLAWKKGLRVKEGANSGQQVQLLLDEIALPYSEVKDFNALPLPFACVATDMVTAEKHTFRSGDLNVALRATMSLPGIFPPVRANGTLYADGGLVDNLPVSVAKEMGATKVIAIYLQTAPLDPDVPMSALTVFGRAISVMIASNEQPSLKAADVVVSVPLQNFTTMQYGRQQAFVNAGYAAAEASKAALLVYAVDDATWAQYIAWRDNRKKQLPVPTFVAIKGLDPKLTARVQKALAADANKPIDTKSVDQQLTLLGGGGRISDASYGLTEKDGQQGLEVTAQEKPSGNTIIRPLIAVDGWNVENILLNLGARVTMLDFGGFRSELRTDVIVGSELGVYSEYLHPLSPQSNVFIASHVIADNSPLYIYTERYLEALYRERTYGGGADLDYIINRNSELRVGYEAEHLRLSEEVGESDDFLPLVDGRTGVTRARYAYEGTNSATVPTAGMMLYAQAKYYDAYPDAGYTFGSAEVRAMDFFPITGRQTIYGGASGGSTLNKNPGGLPLYSLGGSLRLPAYNQNELLTNQYFLFQAGYEYQLSSLPALIGGKVLLLGGVDVAKAYYVANKPGLPADGVLGVVVNTFLGPLIFGGSVGDSGHRRIFVQFGKALFTQPR
jgi:NTE family protein